MKKYAGFEVVENKELFRDLIDAKEKLTIEVIKLREALTRFQRRADTTENELNLARARIYDLLMAGETIPSDMDIKAENIYLKSELKKVIEQRDEAKRMNKEWEAKANGKEHKD